MPPAGGGRDGRCAMADRRFQPRRVISATTNTTSDPAARNTSEASDPDLPTVSDASLVFLAAGSLVVFVVALITLLG